MTVSVHLDPMTAITLGTPADAAAVGVAGDLVSDMA
jgi:hypothetical protein